MKSKKQIAHELHDELLAQLVELEIEVRLLRLKGRQREENQKILERDSIELRLQLLQEFIDGR